MTHELIRAPVEDASREEKTAFFINVYNALVIHANVVRGPPSNLWQRYKVCKYVYLQLTLLEIDGFIIT